MGFEPMTNRLEGEVTIPSLPLVILNLRWEYKDGVDGQHVVPQKQEVTVTFHYTLIV